MVYSQEQLEEKIIHSTGVLSECYQTCLKIYETSQEELNVNLEQFKNQLPKADLDALEKQYENSLSLFYEVKKMISEERKRRRYIQQPKNKKRLANFKAKVELTRRQKRLQDASSVIITNGITELQE